MPATDTPRGRDGGHPLDPLGAFVVQFRAGPMADPDQHPGRIEHVASGEALQFLTSDELMAFIRGHLSSTARR